MASDIQSKEARSSMSLDEMTEDGSMQEDLTDCCASFEATSSKISSNGQNFPGVPSGWTDCGKSVSGAHREDIVAHWSSDL